MHISVWYVLIVCHQYDVCKHYVGSLYVGWYGGLSDTCVGGGGSVVVVSAWYVCGTYGSGIVSSAVNILGMSVVREMRCVGGVYDRCMCLAQAAWEEMG